MRWSRNSIKNTQSILKLLLQKIALVNFFFWQKRTTPGKLGRQGWAIIRLVRAAVQLDWTIEMNTPVTGPCQPTEMCFLGGVVRICMTVVKLVAMGWAFNGLPTVNWHIKLAPLTPAAFLFWQIIASDCSYIASQVQSSAWLKCCWK